MATQCTPNLKSLTTKVTAGIKTLSPLSLIAVASFFLFVGTAHAQVCANSAPCTTGSSCCLFISSFPNQPVQLWMDNGSSGNQHFTQGGATGEGVSCLQGNTNSLYTASASENYISVFNLTTGVMEGSTSSFGAMGDNITALNANSAGTVIYAGQYSIFTILGLAPVIPPVTPWLTLQYEVSGQGTPPVNSHDVSVGPDGNVYATQNVNTPPPYSESGVQKYDPTLTYYLGQYLPGIVSGSGSPCATFGSAGSQCWYQLSGMAWDNVSKLNNGPNLWVSTDYPDSNGVAHNGIFEFSQPIPGNQYYPYATPLNFIPDMGGFPVGLAVAPPGDPSNPGDIIVANNSPAVANVLKINPSTCTGTVNAPGTCTSTVFITASQFMGRPKYPVYYTSCPNPDNNGYVEICKQSDPNHPVTGTFDFTVTAPFFNSGAIQVPVGDCSGPIQVPSAVLPNTDTITETPVIGDLVDNVTAIAYNQSGQQFNQLGSWTDPNPYAGVGVQAGDISLGTLATFTNEGGISGQLKVCKIAGPGTPVGTGPFNFAATGAPSFSLLAGPEDQGGYCELVKTYPANTPVTITEVYRPTLPYHVPPNGIKVHCDGCTYNITVPSVTTTIGAGITEADFTNIPNMMGGAQCPWLNTVYSDGPVNATVDAWAINYGFVTSDSFNTPAVNTTLTGVCFYAWLYPGDTLNSAEVSITSSENGGTSYFDQTEPFTCALFCTAGQPIGSGVCGAGVTNVYACSALFNVTLASSGSFWLNLANAVSAKGEEVYWDENSGPSSASINQIGTIPAESFLIYGYY